MPQMALTLTHMYVALYSSIVCKIPFYAGHSVHLLLQAGGRLAAVLRGALGAGRPSPHRSSRRLRPRRRRRQEEK